MRGWRGSFQVATELGCSTFVVDGSGLHLSEGQPWRKTDPNSTRNAWSLSEPLRVSLRLRQADLTRLMLGSVEPGVELGCLGGEEEGVAAALLQTVLGHGGAAPHVWWSDQVAFAHPRRRRAPRT